MVKKLTQAEKTKAWKKKNPERVRASTKRYVEKHKDEIIERNRVIRNKMYFGGKSEEIFERDNWQCQKCGMSPEQSILLFNRRLAIHHIDGNGEKAEITNNELDNLITLCIRCHCELHKKARKIEKWGELLEQDNSKWKFPKLKKLVDSKLSKDTNITQAKRIIAKELEVSFWTIDGYYYEKKEKHDDL